MPVGIDESQSFVCIEMSQVGRDGMPEVRDRNHEWRFATLQRVQVVHQLSTER